MVYQKLSQKDKFIHEQDINTKAQHQPAIQNVTVAAQLLALQRAAGNSVTRKIVSAKYGSLQRMHHTEEARSGDHRKGAVEELSHYPKGTIGYSLWGVYRNFDRMPTLAVGDGSGLRTLIRNNEDLLHKPIPKDPGERQQIAHEWGRKESETFANSSDEQTRKAGAMLSPGTRGTLFSTWQTFGTLIPDSWKSDPNSSK